MEVTRNQTVRCLLHLSYTTHTWLFGPLMNQAHIRCQLIIRSLKFKYKCLHSSNDIVSYVIKLSINNANSLMRSKYAFLKSKYNIDMNNNINDNITKLCG